jgi:hypothetical protein
LNSSSSHNHRVQKMLISSLIRLPGEDFCCCLYVT